MKKLDGNNNLKKLKKKLKVFLQKAYYVQVLQYIYQKKMKIKESKLYWNGNR